MVIWTGGYTYQTTHSPLKDNPISLTPPPYTFRFTCSPVSYLFTLRYTKRFVASLAYLYCLIIY